MIRIAICLVFTLCPILLFAQKEDHNWVLSNHLRVDFNQQPSIVTTDISQNVGNSQNLTSISNNIGNLLFYINGLRLYNYNHQVIFTTPAASFFNQVNVVPHPTDAKKYFWFVRVIGTELTKKLTLYTIDMNANTGLGSVSETYSLVGADMPINFVISRISNSADYWFTRFYPDKIIVNSLTSTGLSNGTIYNIALGENSTFSKITPDMSTIFVNVGTTAFYALDIIPFAFTLQSKNGLQRYRNICKSK